MPHCFCDAWGGWIDRPGTKVAPADHFVGRDVAFGGLHGEFRRQRERFAITAIALGRRNRVE